jgi:DNA replication protein DnaC
MRDELSPPNAQDILEVLDDRYSQASTIVAAQMPVVEWFTRIPDPTLADAILDRLVHNAYRITTDPIRISVQKSRTQASFTSTYPAILSTANAYS